MTRPRVVPNWRSTDYGDEKLCTRCREWWPADAEFFSRSARARDGLFYCCKAYYSELARTRVGLAREAA
jgi:hypothetical protein